MCVLGVSILHLSTIYYWTLELFRHCGIFCFYFYFIILYVKTYLFDLFLVTVLPEDCLSWHTDMYFQSHFLEIDVLGFDMMSLFQPYYVSFRTTHDLLMNNCIISPFVDELNAKTKKTIKIIFYGIFARTYWKLVDNTIKTCLTTTIGMRCRKYRYFYYRWNIKFRWNINFFMVSKPLGSIITG